MAMTPADEIANLKKMFDELDVDGLARKHTHLNKPHTFTHNHVRTVAHHILVHLHMHTHTLVFSCRTARRSGTLERPELIQLLKMMGEDEGRRSQQEGRNINLPLDSDRH